MDVLLAATVGVACIALAAITAVDAADRIRDHDPVAIFSVCAATILVTAAAGAVAVVLALLDTAR